MARPLVIVMALKLVVEGLAVTIMVIVEVENLKKKLTKLKSRHLTKFRKTTKNGVMGVRSSFLIFAAKEFFNQL